MMGVTMAGADDSGADTMMPARFGFMNPRRRMRMMAMQAEMSKDGSVFFFDSRRHDFGDKVFLGHTIRGSGADEVEQALDILAASPKTAHHISYQLAQYF